MKINIVECEDCKYLRRITQCEVRIGDKVFAATISPRVCYKHDWWLPEDVTFCNMGKPKE